MVKRSKPNLSGWNRGSDTARPRARASASYDAASYTSQELASFRPPLGSADGAYLPNRDTIVSRTRHLTQNSAWASSALTRQLDSVIGVGFRPSLKPDYVALGWTPAQARKFASQVKSRWNLFANDPGCWIDAQRRKNFTGLMRLAYREYVMGGEAIALALWNDNKPNGRPATTIQVVDSDLMSNPGSAPDTESLRGGVELDDYGAATAYHFRNAHPGDGFLSGAKSFTWTRVPRETEWGRRRVIHAYEEQRPNQTRGISRFTAILARFKMLDKYEQTELQAALLNAILAAYIKSPMDHELLLESMDDSKLSDYQKLRGEFRDENGIQLNGVKLPSLFPGEEIGFIDAKRPNSSFSDFERSFLRSFAAATGITYEQLSQDWSQVNYSSARAALMEIWKTLNADRTIFADQFATPIFALWFEEMMDAGAFDLPPGSPVFEDMPAAYLSLKWIGMGRGYVDPEKEAKAANMRINTRISTLEEECAEQGKDFEEVLEQQAAEIELMNELGLPLPDWATAQPTYQNQFTGEPA
jgi:lambda family phage portal protein